MAQKLIIVQSQNYHPKKRTENATLKISMKEAHLEYPYTVGHAALPYYLTFKWIFMRLLIEPFGILNS